MATPHAAGAAVLVLRALEVAGDADRSPAHVQSILTSTTSSLGPADFYGAGLLDVYKAVRTARGADPAVPVLSASPRTVRLYGNPPQGRFVVSNTGKAQDIDATATVTHVSEPGFIISVTPDSTTILSGPSGVSFTVTASPGPLTPSLRYAEIQVTSPDAQTERVYAVHKDTGAVYVVLFEVISFSPYTTVPLKAVASSPDGGFTFAFDDLEEGYYLLGASTDRDGDGLIFDSGEAYGFFGAPDYENATLISLGGSTTFSDMNLQIIDWE